MCPVHTGMFWFLLPILVHTGLYSRFSRKILYVNADNLGSLLRYSMLLNATAMCKHRWMLYDV